MAAALAPDPVAHKLSELYLQWWSTPEAVALREAVISELGSPKRSLDEVGEGEATPPSSACSAEDVHTTRQSSRLVTPGASSDDADGANDGPTAKRLCWGSRAVCAPSLPLSPPRSPPRGSAPAASVRSPVRSPGRPRAATFPADAAAAAFLSPPRRRLQVPLREAALAGMGAGVGGSEGEAAGERWVGGPSSGPFAASSSPPRSDPTLSRPTQEPVAPAADATDATDEDDVAMSVECVADCAADGGLGSAPPPLLEGGARNSSAAGKSPPPAPPAPLPVPALPLRSAAAASAPAADAYAEFDAALAAVGLPADGSLTPVQLGLVLRP